MGDFFNGNKSAIPIAFAVVFAVIEPLRAQDNDNKVRLCDDASMCRVGEACVGGQCTSVTDHRVRILFPLAVDRILNLDSGKRSGASQKRVDELLRRYLDLSGFFQLLDARRNPPGAVIESLRLTTIDFQAWYDAGAYAFIKGTLQTSRPGKVQLTLRLYLAEEGERQPMPAEVQELSAGDGAALKRAVARWVDDLVVAYSGKGGSFSTRIAFAKRMTKRGAKEIMVMDMDGENEREITKNGSINLLPAWTRDGKVAYSSFLTRNPDLYVEGKKLSSRPRMNTGATFHPNGKHLALTLSKDGSAEVYVLSVRDGRVIRRLTHNRVIDTSPTWSPDGKRLAFVSNRNTGRPRIYMMEANGSDPKKLPQVGGYNSSPDWSPSGDEIAYSAMVGSERYDIYVIQLSTGTVRRLTSRGSNEEPSYSPDGRYIVYSSTRSGGRQLWIMTADGRNKRRISRGKGNYYTPAWER